MNRTIEFINNLNISKDEYIVVACSGGPDSIFLLQLLNNIGFKCVCAHVNHNVREASKDEYEFLNNFCINNNIVFEGVTINEYNTKLNFHEFAREFRYDFFKKVLDKYNSKYLFTAHHGDDLIETILMRLTRGSSIRGYAGFESIVDKKNYKIIRPLVFLNKNEIEKFDKENNIEYVVDESNLTDHYTRNRFRHHVIPSIKDEDPQVHLKFLSYSEELYEAVDFIDSIVNDKLKDMYRNKILDLSQYNEESTFIKKQLLEKILKDNYPNNLYLVDKKNIQEILHVIDNKKPNITFYLPDNLKIIKQYNKIVFTRDKVNLTDYNIELQDKVEINNFIIKMTKMSDDKSNNIIRLNSKDIKLPLYIRNKKNGDTIFVKNSTGKTKIKKIFIDNKIPENERKSYPLLVDANDEILWIPGLKKSKKDIEKNKEYDIIIISDKRRD